jgi:mannose/cellobiose epimerase-like protein (N-acyl-D-glucosamine 2-epimerase family)
MPLLRPRVRPASGRAHRTGVSGGFATLERAYGVLDKWFFEPEYGLYADEASADWGEHFSYRGQNANMHACEALIAAHEATDREEYLERAYTVVERFTREVTGTTDGLLWEHYIEVWEPDLEYNREKPRHQFRPWGYRPSTTSSGRSCWYSSTSIVHESGCSSAPTRCSKRR